MIVLVTDKETGPKGWEMVPVNDVNVFYNPNKIKEGKMMQIISDFENGDTESMDEIADYDTPIDREENDY
jgi:hypothetical protein